MVFLVSALAMAMVDKMMNQTVLLSNTKERELHP